MARTKIKLEEIEIFNKENIYSIYGTNEHNTNVFYIRTKTKITPKEKKDSYEEDILNFKNIFQNKIYSLIKENDNFENETLLSIDVSSKNLSYNKNSHLKYDLIIKTKNIFYYKEAFNILKTLAEKVNEILLDTLSKNNILNI